MMRYLLESQNENVCIEEEFDFLKSYIALMQLRYSERVKVFVDLSVSFPEKKIPPFLFISLVENAFKYGVNQSSDTNIDIAAKTDTNYLIFHIKNSKYPENHKQQTTGVGLKNLQKQLTLLYGVNYRLSIVETDAEFNVSLKIPLQND